MFQSKRMIVVAVVFLASLLLAYSSQGMGQSFFMGHPLMDKAAPDFTLKTIKGQQINFATFRSKQPAILFFWATWCPHCRIQLPRLNAVAPSLAQKGIKLLLIDLEEDAETVQAYLTKTEVDQDVLLDKGADVADKYVVMGVPSYFFVDSQGSIRAVEHELPDNYEDILRGKQ